jgi:hypothetical protein
MKNMNTESELNETVASDGGPDSMRTYRRGKIAHLPRAIREEVNRRLEAHQSGPKIVNWLNAEPAVKEVLDREFGGKPISRQNLSQWRRDGFQEWRYHNWAVVYLRKLAGDDAEPTGMSNQRLVAVMGRMCMEELGAAIQRSRDEGMSTEKRFKYLCTGIGQINAMRREDNRAGRIALEQKIGAHEVLRTEFVAGKSNQPRGTAEAQWLKGVRALPKMCSRCVRALPTRFHKSLQIKAWLGPSK